MAINRILLTMSVLSLTACAERGPERPSEVGSPSGENGQRLLVRIPDGLTLKEFERSRDGRRISYAAIEGSHMITVLDGVRQPAFDATGFLTFSPDGKRFAYGARKDGTFHVILDGVEDEPHGAIADLVFSPDSRRFSYLFTQEEEDRVYTHIVVDGHPSQRYRGAGDLAFSPDSRHYAYMAIGEDRKESMVLDGVPGPVYDRINHARPIFSPDSRSLSYAAWTDGVAFPVLRGVRGSSYEDLRALRISPDGKRVSFIAYKDILIRQPKGFVVVDDVPGPLFKGVGPCAWSPDSRHFAHVGRTPTQSFVVRDGVPGTEAFSGIVEESLAFSPDGSRLAFIETPGKDRQRVVLDSIRSEPFDRVFRPLTFSEDGLELRFIAQRASDILEVRLRVK